MCWADSSPALWLQPIERQPQFKGGGASIFTTIFLAPDLRDRVETTGPAGPLAQWSSQRSAEAMEQAGIATAILSGMTGYGAVPEPAREMAYRARVNNEYGARLVSENRGRFGLFATLPLPYIDESMREIAFALDTLKADGLFAWTHYGNQWIGDPAFGPVFEELSRRKAVVMMHPKDAPCCIGLHNCCVA
jgi:predicted TIM-barrel fold metal-dependent hydrolase